MTPATQQSCAGKEESSGLPVADARFSFSVLTGRRIHFLRVCQHHPRGRALPNVCPASSRAEKPLDLSLLIERPEVQVKPVLGVLGFWYRDKDQPGQPVCRWTDLKFVRRVVNDDPAQRVCPPPPKATRVRGVYDDLLPFQVHRPTLRPGAVLGRVSLPAALRARTAGMATCGRRWTVQGAAK
jgi:hypothetical protein